MLCNRARARLTFDLARGSGLRAQGTVGGGGRSPRQTAVSWRGGERVGQEGVGSGGFHTLSSGLVFSPLDLSLSAWHSAPAGAQDTLHFAPLWLTDVQLIPRLCYWSKGLHSEEVLFCLVS